MIVHPTRQLPPFRSIRHSMGALFALARLEEDYSTMRTDLMATVQKTPERLP